MRRLIVVLLLVLFAACDGPYYRVVIEEYPMDPGCCVQEEEPYNPNLVDTYSEDTNWYIDDVGNIVWKK